VLATKPGLAWSDRWEYLIAQSVLEAAMGEGIEQRTTITLGVIHITVRFSNGQVLLL
jgi:hypothetical protein